MISKFANGLTLDINKKSDGFEYKILDQSNDFTDAIRFLKIVTDPQTGLSLKVNKKPAFNSNKKRFFLRGTHKKSYNSIVNITRDKLDVSVDDAIEALKRMVNNVKMPETAEKPGIPVKGGTSDVRFALITKNQAKKLELTAKDKYPDVRTWKKKKPIVTNNQHYNEHIGQIVDVLNKSLSNEVYSEDYEIINPHKVTPKQAKQAVDAVRRLIDEAEDDKYLIALWRVVTGLRSVDVE